MSNSTKTLPAQGSPIARLALLLLACALALACGQRSAPTPNDSETPLARHEALADGSAGAAALETCVEPLLGIIGWWSMDETSGTTVDDLAGTNAGLTVNEPVFADGAVSGALRFNGANSYVGAPDSDLWRSVIVISRSSYGRAGTSSTREALVIQELFSSVTMKDRAM